MSSQVRKLSHFLGGQVFEKAVHFFARIHADAFPFRQAVHLHVNFRYSEQIHRIAERVFDKLIWWPPALPP